MTKKDKMILGMMSLVAIIAVAICIMILRVQAPRAREGTVGKGIEGIERFTTDNGLTVFYLYAPELPMVDIKLMLDGGSRHDKTHPGLAALTNSMLDQGTKNRNVEDLANGFADVGAQFEHGVSEDYAYMSLRSLADFSKLRPAMLLFLDILENANFPESNFIQQQDQQVQGLKFQQQNPAQIAQRTFTRLLYNNHPYGHSVDGDVGSVAQLTSAQARQFFRTRYGLNRSVVAIVGAIERSDAQKMASDIGHVLMQRHTEVIHFPEPKMPQVAARSIDFPSAQTHILMGALGIKRGDPDYFPLYVGNYIFGGGSVSQLFNEVREQRGLAYSAYSYLEPRQQAGPFVITLQTRNEERKKALDTVQNLLRQYLRKGPTGKELSDAKDYITGNFPLRISNNTQMVNYLAMIGYYDLPTNYLATFRQNIEQVTLPQIQDVLQRRLNADRMVIVTVGA